MIELNISDLRKKALIKFEGCPDGHVFIVRQPTPGDELALSEVARKRSSLIIKASELQQKSLKANDKTSDKEKDAITSDIEKTIEDIAALEQEELKIKARIFDDGKDGKLSVDLYNSLTEFERGHVIESVMNDQSIVPEK